MVNTSETENGERVTAVDWFIQLRQEEVALHQRLDDLIRAARDQGLGETAKAGISNKLNIEASAVLLVLQALADGTPLDKLLENYPHLATVDLSSLLGRRPVNGLDQLLPPSGGHSILAFFFTNTGEHEQNVDLPNRAF